MDFVYSQRQIVPEFPKMRTTSVLANKLYADRGKTGDIIFIVDTERIIAHKSVLAALSPKYDAQFYGNQPDEGVVIVKDITPAAFEEFIKFCYIEDANLTVDNIEEILNRANQSLINHIVTRCGLFLINALNKRNICWVYRLALLYDIKAVEDLCVHRIRSYLPQIFKTTDFLECDHNVLIQILDFKTVNCTEVDIFEGCLSWAQAECQRQDIDDSDSKNLRAVLRSAIDHIRFRSMNINQFVQLNKKYDGFFSAEEFREITNIIVDIGACTSQNFNQTTRGFGSFLATSSEEEDDE